MARALPPSGDWDIAFETMGSHVNIEATFDVVVVGAGHAGTEAAVAAARLGARVAIVTSALETIGQMSCNPAIGGVAKGTVVREVDALGGIMGRATDLATLQFRMLNRGKGPAVWAPRAQCDRGLYRRAVRSLLEEHATLATIQGTVARLLIDEGSVVGIETLEGRRFGASCVVLTTGTFLRGRIHIGTETKLAGGRAGERAELERRVELRRRIVVVLDRVAGPRHPRRLEPRDGVQHSQLHVHGQRRREPVHVQLVRVVSLGLEEDLMPLGVREPEDLVLHGRTVARTA